MNVIQENKTGWPINPVINGQINQPLVYHMKKEASLRIHSGIEQSPFISNTSTTFQNAGLKPINYQMYHPIFRDHAFADMSLGLIPNFEQLVRGYLEIEPEAGKLLPAIKFLPALRDLSLNKKEITSLLEHPEPKHILVQNDQVKIILIRWQPLELSAIHGHAIGGGLIKVLHGEIKENRYTADSQQQLLSKSTYFTDHIAYIDDVMGLHSIGNGQDSPSITLHICTPGNYKPKKYEKAN